MSNKWEFLPNVTVNPSHVSAIEGKKKRVCLGGGGGVDVEMMYKL